MAESLRNETFVKLTLSNYKGADATLQKLLIRRIRTKKGDRLDLTYRHNTRDIAKNYALDEAVYLISGLIGREFRNATLFTTTSDVQIAVLKTGEAKFSETKPSFTDRPESSHDRAKNSFVDPHSRYLQELGITSGSGEVLGKQRDKWIQINKFIEVVTGLIDNSSLKNETSISVVDMGSGKGYLTFAMYDYLSNSRRVEVSITGVEARQDLVDLCNDVAHRCGFAGLRFVRNTIEGFAMPAAADITIALHACDTATDDAIFKGITARSEIIITAPCCHKEIRRQIKPPDSLAGVLKHGTLLESTAETITDGLRALILEREGYAARVFEFVAPEHTPKNNMIVGTRRRRRRETVANSEIDQLRSLFGIRSQRLDDLLAMHGLHSDQTADFGQ